MDEDIEDLQIRPVGLNTPAVVVVELVPVNHVVIRIDIHPMTEAVFGGRPMTACIATAMDMRMAQRITAVAAAGMIARRAVDRDPLVLHVRDFDGVNRVVLPRDHHAVTDPAPTPVNRQIADGDPAHPRPERKAGRRAPVGRIVTVSPDAPSTVLPLGGWRLFSSYVPP